MGQQELTSVIDNFESQLSLLRKAIKKESVKRSTADKIVLNIQTGNNEYKECDVLFDDFINYYCELTDFIDGRINEKKFVRYEMFNKNEDTLTTLSSNDKCIKDYLKA